MLSKLTIFICVLLTLHALLLSQTASALNAIKIELVENTSAISKEVFEDYKELEIMRMLTLTTVQSMSGEEVTSDTVTWVHLVWKIIDDFDEMNKLTKSDLAYDHIQAMQIAENIKHDINELRVYDSNISFFPDLALNRFYEMEGEYFEEYARNEPVTKLKIEYYKQAKIAYQESNEISKASRLEYNRKKLENKYNRDMSIAKKYIVQSKSLLQNAKSTNNLQGLRDILNARNLYKKAFKIYEEHNDEELNNIKNLESDIEKVYHTLMWRIIIAIAKYLIIFIIILLIISPPIKKWKKDIQDTNLGRELVLLRGLR
ncbi:MAG: hypothetical protein ACE5J3_04585 [Methanosarcinales archaeon]